MLRGILKTDNNIGIALVRLALGIVMFPHGAQKMLGWFGGQGFNRTMGMFNSMHIPALFGFLAIMAELLGSLGLLTGLLTRIAALGIAAEMLVAIVKVHSANGFFMNWTGAQKGEGFEYHILVLGITLALLLKGGGALSFDRVISREK
jgi:putative oxidoreductase